jgi:hypothetical protein
MTQAIWRMVKRVGVCWRRGHVPWSDEMSDPWCDRCGKQLGPRVLTGWLVEVK